MCLLFRSLTALTRAHKRLYVCSFIYRTAQSMRWDERRHHRSKHICMYVCIENHWSWIYLKKLGNYFYSDDAKLHDFSKRVKKNKKSIKIIGVRFTVQNKIQNAISIVLTQRVMFNSLCYLLFFENVLSPKLLKDYYKLNPPDFVFWSISQVLTKKLQVAQSINHEIWK